MTIRFLCFLLGVIVLVVLEHRSYDFLHRLFIHALLLSLGVILALCVPLNAWIDARWGLLNTMTLPAPIRFILSLLWLDFVLYAQHRLFHALPFCWRFHAVHHSDSQIDTSTGIRFHPVEVLLSTLIKGCAVLVMGCNFFEFTCFQIWLNMGSLFSHANLRLPYAVTKQLDKWIVTPAAHRMHHLNHYSMQMKNFGFGLLVWDRIFKTYISFSELPQSPMYGLNGKPDLKVTTITELLMQPVKIV